MSLTIFTAEVNKIAEGLDIDRSYKHNLCMRHGPDNPHHCSIHDSSLVWMVVVPVDSYTPYHFQVLGLYVTFSIGQDGAADHFRYTG